MIEVDRYILENIENTLRLCANHFDSYKKTTCLDRNIISDLNCVRKFLNGEESIIVGTQHFDYGNENLEIDITKYVNDTIILLKELDKNSDRV